MLSSSELTRYSRQIVLTQIGLVGQQRLSRCHIVVVGAGGLGCPVLMYLVAAGVGKITLIDGDKVELSNLQRQVLYKNNHLQKPKVNVAVNNLFGLNNHVDLRPKPVHLTAKNAESLLMGADVVMDCSDNFETRYLLNAVCKEHQLLLIAGAARGLQGQLWVFDQRQNEPGCLNCLFPQDGKLPAENCQNAGVLGPVLGIIGSLQASEAILYLTEQKRGHSFVQLDALTLTWQHIQPSASQDCALCF